MTDEMPNKTPVPRVSFVLGYVWLIAGAFTLLWWGHILESAQGWSLPFTGAWGWWALISWRLYKFYAGSPHLGNFAALALCMIFLVVMVPYTPPLLDPGSYIVYGDKLVDPEGEHPSKFYPEDMVRRGDPRAKGRDTRSFYTWEHAYLATGMGPDLSFPRTGVFRGTLYSGWKSLPNHVVLGVQLVLGMLAAILVLIISKYLLPLLVMYSLIWFFKKDWLAHQNDKESDQ